MVARASRFSWRGIAFWLIQVGIAVGLCWLLFRNVDIHQLVAAISHANFGYLSAAVVALFVERIVRPYRLATLFGRQIALIEVIALQSVSQLINLVLPLRSGEMFLVIMLRTIGRISVSFALSIVTVDRLMDLVCMLLMLAVAVVAAPGLPAYVDRAVAFLTIACALLLTLIIILIVTKSKAVAIVDHVLARFMGPLQTARWRQHLEQIIEGFSVLLDISRLVPALLATMVTWGSATVAVWLVLAAVWPGAPFAAAALAVCLGAFGVALTSVPAGIGIIHAAYTLAAVGFGASQEVGLAFAIIAHFLAIAVTIVLGVVGLPTARRAGMSMWMHAR